MTCVFIMLCMFLGYPATQNMFLTREFSFKKEKIITFSMLRFFLSLLFKNLFILILFLLL